MLQSILKYIHFQKKKKKEIITVDLISTPRIIEKLVWYPYRIRYKQEYQVPVFLDHLMIVFFWLLLIQHSRRYPFDENNGKQNIQLNTGSEPCEYSVTPLFSPHSQIFNLNTDEGWEMHVKEFCTESSWLNPRSSM